MLSNSKINDQMHNDSNEAEYSLDKNCNTGCMTRIFAYIKDWLMVLYLSLYEFFPWRRILLIIYM